MATLESARMPSLRDKQLADEQALADAKAKAEKAKKKKNE